MSDELPRAFGKIQVGRRIAITKPIMEQLEWEIDDKVLIEAYRGKLIVENLSRTPTIRPLKERLNEKKT